jgi:flagellar assembly protein FliH
VSVRPSVVPPSNPYGGAPRASVIPQVIQTTREVELDGEVDALRREVARLARELAAARARVLEESEPEIVRLAVAVATRVVGRELAQEPSTIVGWIKDGIAVLPQRDEVIVAVAPDIAAAMPAEEIAAGLGSAKVIVDSTLRPGSCEVREGASTVEVSADARLAAISDALGVDHR